MCRSGPLQIISRPLSKGSITSESPPVNRPLYLLIVCLRSHLGDIKYLKDGELDADLDPEMSVYDAFVDAGKATTSLLDQKATIKIILEIRGKTFGVREGSVVPDLSNPRFQPRNLPPVPRFSDTSQTLGKRSRDDAFRDEDSGRDRRLTTKSTRTARLNAVEEIAAAERLVPSIERDLRRPSREASRHRQGSPIVIPETQESPSRYGAGAQQGGSDILGDEEPKSESPEVGNSIHSLPMVQKHVDDMAVVETASPTQNIATTRMRDTGEVQAAFEGAPGQEPTSRSSSNYYSPPSGSLQSNPKRKVSGEESASSLAETTVVINQADPTPSFAPTKLNLATEGAVENGPITPTSDASRHRPAKATAQESTHIVPSGVRSSSRTSSFSYKFRRGDRVPSVESEIDDTQMSPRSRKSMRRPRNARYAEAEPKVVGVRELSGPFRNMDKKRPLIQERKRQRNETTWDSSERTEELSEAEIEDVSPNEYQSQDEDQQANAGSDLSERDEGEDNAGQRSKSRALSDATNKDSNASTERPIMSSSVNALRLSPPEQNQALRHGSSSDIMGENDSDKENADREQEIAPQLCPLDVLQSVEVTAQGPSKALHKENANVRHKPDVTKHNDGSVIDILNNVTTTQNDEPTRSSARNAQQSPSEVSEPLKVSSVPAHASLKKSRSRKKKSHVEEEEGMPKPGPQQPMGDSVVKVITTNASTRANHEILSSASKSKIGKSTVSRTEPDEQLSQDLQASAQAGNKKLTPILKDRKALAREQAASSRDGAGTAGMKSAGASSNKSLKATTEMGQNPSITYHERKSSDGRKSRSPMNVNAEAVAVASVIPAEKGCRQKSKDGKLGLGFSQSPPGKIRGLLESKRSFGNVNHGVRNETLALPTGKEERPFLKKPNCFKKLKSNQSRSVDTPSRSAQPEKHFDSTPQHARVDIPGKTPDTFDAQTNTKGSGRIQTISSGSESAPESGYDEDISSTAGEEASKGARAIVKNGVKNVSADAPVPSIEITSGSASSESDTVLPSPKAVSKAGKPQNDGPKIIPKGNNVYTINGAQIVVPPGFTLDRYLAMRADLANQAPKPNSRSRVTSSGKSATPTLNQKGSSATPVPAQVKVATKKAVSKKNDKQQANATKGNDITQESTAPPAAKVSVKQITNTSKTKDLTRPSPAVTAKKAPVAERPTTPKTQAPTKASVSTNNRPGASTSTSSKLVVPPPAKSNTLTPSNPARKTTYLGELVAQKEAERAEKQAASSSKTSGMTSPNLANIKDLMNGEDSDSESETESETSSDEGVMASKPRAIAARTPATGFATVDLSIRDPSPSWDDEDSD